MVALSAFPDVRNLGYDDPTARQKSSPGGTYILAQHAGEVGVLGGLLDETESASADGTILRRRKSEQHEG